MPGVYTTFVGGSGLDKGLCGIPAEVPGTWPNYSQCWPGCSDQNLGPSDNAGESIAENFSILSGPWLVAGILPLSRLTVWLLPGLQQPHGWEQENPTSHSKTRFMSDALLFSRKRVMNHNWSARKQRFHLQGAAGISCHSALSEDRIRECGTSSGSRCKDTDQCL